MSASKAGKPNTTVSTPLFFLFVVVIILVILLPLLIKELLFLRVDPAVLDCLAPSFTDVSRECLVSSPLLQCVSGILGMGRQLDSDLQSPRPYREKRGVAHERTTAILRPLFGDSFLRCFLLLFHGFADTVDELMSFERARQKVALLGRKHLVPNTSLRPTISPAGPVFVSEE